MATIKEIAKETGFSPSTVSIVLRGKSADRHISQGTKQTILETAQRLGYRVNVAARMLRANQGSGMTVSVFMALDRRAYMMMRFLLGLQNALAERGQPFEIVIHSYKSGALSKLAETIAISGSVIICNASAEDMRFLEESQFVTPIVTLFRNSEKYCSVGANLTRMGTLIAEIFARRGHKHAIFLATESYYSGLEERRLQFIETAEKLGMKVTTINVTHDMKGGYEGGNIIGRMSPLPDSLFCTSNSMAFGVLRAFGQLGIKIPEQIEIINSGVESPDFDEYASTPLSAASIPIELLAQECVTLLLKQLDGELDAPVAVEVPFEYVVRESCGP